MISAHDFRYSGQRLSPAKINLFLSIEGRLENGYHSLSTLMQTITPADRISLKVTRCRARSESAFICPAGEKQVRCPAASERVGRLDALQIMQGGSTFEPLLRFTYSPRILELSHQLDCPPEQNLITKAARAFWRSFIFPFLSPEEEDFFWLLEFDLQKQIPAQAGLGGGSSNAAAVLLLLWEYLAADHDLRAQLGIRQPALPDLNLVAAGLGADVPFFLQGGLAYCTGIGDVVEPLPALPAYPVLLVQPDFSVSTAAAFELWDRQLEERQSRSGAANLKSDLKQMALSALARGDWGLLGKEGGNVFEQLTPSLGQFVSALRHSATRAGALLVQLSGSGSAAYCVFPDEKSRDLFAASLGPAPAFANRPCQLYMGHFLQPEKSRCL